MEPIVISNNIVRPVVLARFSGPNAGGGGGAGTVTTVSVTTANGVSGVVANPTTTPAITITLGAITPTSVVASGNVTGANLSGTNTGDVTLSGESYLSIAGQVITVAAVNLSGTHVTGTLAAARFGALTGDVTSAGGTYATSIAVNAVTTTKIADANVTLAKLATQADQTFLGNNTGGVASPIALTVAQAKTMLNLSGTNTGDQTITLTGDVTGSGTGSFATTIANDAITTVKILNDAVTLAKIADIADSTFLGNNTGGAASPVALTVAQAKTLLNLTGTNSGDVTLSGENYLSIAGQVITVGSVNLSGSHVTGTLAAARVGTFTGDVTSAGGSYALTIANDAVVTAKILDANVTFAKIQNITDARLLGRSAGSDGVMQHITVASPLTLSAGALDFDETAVLGNNARVAVSKAGVAVGTRRKLNFIEGSNVTLTIADDAGNEEIDITIAASGGGGGTPGGSDTQIQYNDGGAFGGISVATYDDSNGKLSFGTFTNTGSFVTVLASTSAGVAVDVTNSADGGVAVSGTASGIGNIGLRAIATGTVAVGVQSLLSGSATAGTAFQASTNGGQVLTGIIEDGVTNTVTAFRTFTHNSTGSATTNFGIRQIWQLESSTTASQDAAYLDVIWRNPTHASRQGAFVFSLGSAGAPAERMRMYYNTISQNLLVIDTVSAGIGLAFNIGSTQFMLDVPDGSSSGGNARGTISVDLQTARDTAAQVASGTGSNILGGARNTAAGSYSVAVGDTCSSSGSYSFASGQSSLASKYGQLARASAPGVTQGSQQMAIYTMSCATTSATPEEMRLDGDAGSQRLTVANNQCIYYYIQVVGKRATTQEVAIYEFIGAIDKATTAASTRLAVNNKTVIVEDDANCDCGVTADTTNGALTITVTGVTSKNYTWVATIWATEVTV